MRLSLDLIDRLALSVQKKERARAHSVVQTLKSTAQAQGKLPQSYLLAQVEQRLYAISHGKGLNIDIKA
jgi:hypothetical protein